LFFERSDEMLKQFIKDGDIISATEKAYKVVYKQLGYKPYKEENEVEADIDLNSLKADELRQIAKEKGIEGYDKMKKDELIAALAGE